VKNSKTDKIQYQTGKTTKVFRFIKNRKANPAFTIVELLVVIVVIAILATITIVSYAGITKQASSSSVQSNLKQLTITIDLDHATNGTYPATNAAINGGKGLPVTSGINYSYNSLDSSTNYCASAASTAQTDIVYHYTPADGQIKSGACPAVGVTCPIGYIVVPGSTTYGTSDFCVMKYEAKNVAGVATSQAAGLPWVSINQADATTASSTACTGCHLITEAEWMTIAQNVLGVASNWSGGAVGSGYIYSGHNDDAPDNALATSTDNDGYYSTGNSSFSGTNQRRTLTLSNGEVIWDLAGNVSEWTSGVTNGTTAQQPGVTGAGWTWRGWTTATTQGSLAVNPFPSSTGISGSSNWTSSNGIGQLYSNADNTSLYGFVRGGAWYSDNGAGVLTLSLGNGSGLTSTYLGFRVSR
jgi:prepilin-type N-terminal cleavage/methylation domain-containing protein